MVANRLLVINVRKRSKDVEELDIAEVSRQGDKLYIGVDLRKTFVKNDFFYYYYFFFFFFFFFIGGLVRKILETKKELEGSGTQEAKPKQVNHSSVFRNR